jgi:hypothetical protein
MSPSFSDETDHMAIYPRRYFLVYVQKMLGDMSPRNVGLELYGLHSVISQKMILLTNLVWWRYIER